MCCSGPDVSVVSVRCCRASLPALLSRVASVGCFRAFLYSCCAGSSASRFRTLLCSCFAGPFRALSLR
eukprot:678744-Alexandrium_andersonii.AAC.1